MRVVRGETVTRAATPGARGRGSVALAMGLAVTLGAGLARGAAAQQIPVQLGGSTSSLVGLPFDVPLEVDMSARSDKLGSVALTLRWNPAVLKYVDGQNGNFGDIKANDSAAADSGIIRLAAANPVGVGGRVLLGVARFVPLTTAADTFKLDVTELYAAGSFANLLPSAVWSNRAYCNALGRFGDIDGDGAVNSKDALLALTYATGTAVPNAALGDVDGDGATGARDALLMLAAGIGLNVSGFRVYLTAPGACAAPRRPLLALTPGNVTLDLGQRMRYTAVASDSTGAGVAVSDLVWTSSNPLVAAVDTLGQVSALAVGSTTVTVQRPTGTNASAVVTVLARHTHWVEALANPDPDNELGAPELPFATIPQALAYAHPGDTIMVRPGRYVDTLVITQPVVLMGDTSGGGARPLISARSVTDFGVIVHTPGRVELHQLRIDTLTQGVDVPRADTLLVRGVEFRAPASVYYSSLYVDTASAVYLQRSAFFGPSTGYYYSNAGITVDSAALVVMDSSTIAEYGDDGMDLHAVDSVFVRGSTIQHNDGYGVYASGSGIGAAFSGNRFTQNGYGHVYLDVSRGAHFDHNRASGSGYNGIQVYGADTTAGVTFLGDSLATQTSGSPIYLSTYDTLAMDSVVIVGNVGEVYLENGRFAGLHHSKFLGLTSTGLYVYPSSFDTTYVLLRNVAFSGPAKGICDHCADMLDGSNLSVDADSVTMTNMGYGFDLSDSRLVLRHATLDDYYYGAYGDCGAFALAGDTLRNGEYGVELDGCAATDSLVVSGSAFSNHTDAAINGSSVAATVSTGNHFADSYKAISHDCGQLRATGDTVTGGYYGVYAYGCGVTDTLSVDQSSVAGSQYGAYLSSGRQSVTNSQFSDNGYYGVYAESAPVVIANNQVIRPQSTGLYHSWSGPAAGSSQFSNNVVTCDAYGAGNATAIDLVHYSSTVKDTLVADGNSVSNCYQGVYLYGGWQVLARHNTVALPTTVQGYRGISADPDTGLVVVGNTVSGWGMNGSIVAYSARAAVIDSNVVSGGIGEGLYLATQFDSLHVRDNTITNLGYGSGYITPTAAIRLDGSTLGGLSPMAEILRNHITGTTNGIVLNRNVNDALIVQVDSNTVRHADSVGIAVTYYSQASIRKNAIDSAGLDAIRLYTSLAAAPAIIDSNNFTRSQHFGVNNLTAYIVDATLNWWGNAGGPTCDTCATLGDSVSTNVTYTPFLGAPVGTYTPAPPLVAATRLAAPLVASAPAVETAKRTWQAPATLAPRPQRGNAAPSSASLTIPAAPPLSSANRVSERLAAAAAERAARLQQREVQQAQRLQQLEARRAAREQRQAERLKAQVARQQQAPSAQPQRRPQ